MRLNLSGVYICINSPALDIMSARYITADTFILKSHTGVIASMTDKATCTDVAIATVYIYTCGWMKVGGLKEYSSQWIRSQSPKARSHSPYVCCQQQHRRALTMNWEQKSKVPKCLCGYDHCIQHYIGLVALFCCCW